LKIVIAGGTGFIGAALVRRLAADGHECTLLIRDAQSPTLDDLPKGVRLAPYGDMPDSADAVLNLAGEPIAGRWNKAKMDRILGSRIEITKMLVDWMANLPTRPKVFLSTSAVGYYGVRDGRPITEADGSDPRNTFLSKVCQEWEREANKAATHGIRVVNMRIGHVLDPSGATLKEMAAKFRRVPMIVPHATSEYMPWIALSDVVGILQFALEHEAVSGPVNVVAPTPATWQEFYDGLGELLHKRVVGRLPYWVLRLVVGRFAEALVDSQRVVPEKVIHEGYRFQHAELGEYLRGLRVLNP